MKQPQYNSAIKILASMLQLLSILICAIVLVYAGTVFRDRNLKIEEFRMITIVIVTFFVLFLICMMYLTLATGRREGEDSVRLYRIDYMPVEILFAIFILYMTALFLFYARIQHLQLNMASILILNGTIVFISDCVLSTIYLSFARKVKADIFIQTSLMEWFFRNLSEAGKEHLIHIQSVCLYLAAVVMYLLCSWGTFVKGYVWAIIGLVTLLAVTGSYLIRQAVQRKKLLDGIMEISSGKLDYRLEESDYGEDYRELAEGINNIRLGLSNAVEENLKSERLKTELITNVSHDIKTPLTSIINYVNLIKMERIQNENVENYLNILEKKSLRLKQLTEDLVEISKINSGAVTLDMQQIDMVELIYQTGGEFNELFEERGLTIITRLPKTPVIIMADGNRIWRVIQNLYNNVAKYALHDTRVYVELKVENKMAEFSIKDVSEQEIKKVASDLSERFVRGDEARGTEGSGLGLSIAKNLTSLMNGEFEITLDGDLFTARIRFPIVEQS